MTKKIVALLAALMILLMSVVAFAQTTPRTVAPRDAAKEGTSLTPASYTNIQIPGVENVGAVPALKYKIAFSNGDMADSWRAAFYNDMINCLKYLNAEFGIEYIVANSGADSAKQIEDIRSLVAQQPDILLFSPNESAPLAVVNDMCTEAGVPFITIDRGIDATVGQGMYLADIQGDNFRDGVAMGISIVEALTQKNGAPKGNVAEISGAVGASVSVYRSAGIRHVLKDYPEIKIIQVVDGGYDDSMAYQGAQDILTAHGNELDCIVCAFDTGCGQAIEVAEVMGYKDLVYVTSNGNAEFLKDYLLTGKVYSVIEYPPTYGVTALEYAIQYLNGNDIPKEVLLAQRFFNIHTEETKAAMEELSAMCEAAGDSYVPGAYGMYDIFPCEGPMWDKYYPQNYIEMGGVSSLDQFIPADPFAPFNVN